MSYRTKLFALLLVTALVPGLVAIGLDYTTTLQLNKSILERSRENTLQGAERGLRLVLDGFLETIDLSSSLLESSLTAHVDSMRLRLRAMQEPEVAARQVLLHQRRAATQHIIWEGIHLPGKDVFLIRQRPKADADGAILRLEAGKVAPWIDTARQCSRPCWIGDAEDPITRRRVVVLAMAVRSDESTLSGLRDPDVPVVAMAYDFSPPRSLFSDGTLPTGSQAFLVSPEYAAKESNATDGASAGLPVNAFAAAVGSAPPLLSSSDAIPFENMLQDLKSGRRGVVLMANQGVPSFWAYGMVPGRPLALVLVSPLAPYLRTVERTQQTIDRTFQEQIRFMGYVLAAMAMLLVLLSSMFSRMVTQPLGELAQAMQRISAGDYTVRVKARKRRRQDEIDSMRRTFNDMAENIEEHERTKEALNVARLIQRRLLPQTAPPLGGWDIAGESLYSKETGGDIYDFILIPPRGDGRQRITLSVGDATGHGIQAALLMTTARAMFRALLSLGKPLSETISELNWLLTRDTYGTGRFLSLFAVEIAERSPVVHWVRCGHEPALLYLADRDAVTHLRGQGAILGVDSSIHFQHEQQTIQAGSILVLATDGVWEATDPEGVMYGHTRLEEMIRTHAKKSAAGIVAAIIEDLRIFRGKDSPEDDSTILVAKYLS